MMKTNLSKKMLLWMYETMLRIRLFEEEIANRWHEQEMRSPPHFYTGQEAVTVGVNAALKKEDQTLGNYRGHGHYLAKGGSSKEFIAEMYCKVTGSNEGKGGSMLISAPSVGYMGSSAIVSGGIPIATGLALASKMLKNKKVVVSFFGDAATEEGVFYESLNFSALKKLPIVYICENNQYAVTSHIDLRQAQPNNITSHAKGFGIPTHTIDGNDIFEVYSTASKAIENARAGKGPTFIEALTYRWHEHVGEKMDMVTGNRTEKEFKSWVKKDPIKRLEKKLLKSGVLSKKSIDNISKLIENEIKEAFNYGIKSKLPTKKDLLKNVYP